jgi:hypothetical protein
VETKEAPAPVGPYSQVGGNLKRKYPEIKEANFVTLGDVSFRKLTDERRKYFLSRNRHAWKKSIESIVRLLGMIMKKIY